MPPVVLVFGHRNPDNDSVCSAVAYARLKSAVDPSNAYVPARLGPVQPETVWVLERFGVPLPEEVAHVRLRVRDVMKTEVATVPPGEPLLAVGRLMKERGIRSVPVVEGGELRGVVTMQILAERYLEEMAPAGFAAMPVEAGRLAEALGGTLAAGRADMVISGDVRIAAAEPETMRRRIRPGDVVIVGDRRRTQPLALEAGACCLVVTSGAAPEPGVLELAAKGDAAVILTPERAYGAARLLSLAHPVGTIMATDPLVVDPDALLSEVAEDLLDSPHREAVVVDGRGQLAGIFTRTDLARAGRRPVILVDHNETAQSADGIEEAAVVEIVDHHRIGDVETAGPALFLNLPVGSTATVVAERYRDLGVPLPDDIAGLLLSAVLTDTVLLKSPTATEVDSEVVSRLSAQLGLDASVFGMEVFRARSAGVEFSADRAVGADLKEYRAGDAKIAVGQVETVDRDEVLAHRDELIERMERLSSDRGYDLVLLMVTDVVREGSELLAVGRTRLAERAFDADFTSGSAWFDGMLSRKKQVAAPLLDGGRRR